ncbi:hypothetical protein ScPMuIL_018510 [Solemya velum]
MVSRVLLVCVNLGFLLMFMEFFETVNCDALDVSAFDYSSRFPEPLDLGDCPTRTVELFFPIGHSGVYGKQICHLRKYGRKRYIQRQMNDTRNRAILNPNDVLVYSGMCRSNSASYFGLLHQGDCYAVDIASNLTFSSKTHIKAYIEYYRDGIEVLEGDLGLPSPPEYHYLYEGMYYLQHQSVGTMEMLIVEITFKEKSKSKAVKLLPVETSQSSYLRDVERHVGLPRKIKIIRFSTARRTFVVRTFSSEGFWEAVSLASDFEHDIRRVRDELRMELIRPILTYGFKPFLTKPPEILNASSESDWNTSTLNEIEIKKILASSRRNKKRCRGSELPACDTINGIVRELKEMQAELHSKRTRWSTLDRPSQINLADGDKAIIRQFSKKLRTLSRQVKISYRGRKRKRPKTKKGRKQASTTGN